MSSKILRFFLFADDTSVYLLGNNIKEREKNICTQELKNVLTWLNANKQ